jgi:hypothetical protein
MGLCDYVTLEGEYPGCALPRGSRCQSQSLYAAGSEFAITAEGKLMQHVYRYENDPEQLHPLGWTRRKRIHLRDEVIAYHGDLLLMYLESAAGLKEWVARFTHGRLEWIKPLDDYPEANRRLLTEQGAQ